MFIGRETELNIVEERINSNKAEFMLIFGRRRIGKTELVKKIISLRGGIILMGRGILSIKNGNSYSNQVNYH
jgi:hypothetical protein